MGVWGAGNFDRDDALDFMGSISEEFEQRIEALFDDEELFQLDEEAEGSLLPSVVILSTLYEKCHATVPAPETVARWKQRYLTLFDEQIDGLEPAKGYKEERRAEIVRTWQRLEMQAEEQAQQRKGI